MKLSLPLSVTMPDYGVLFAESVHATDFRMAEREDPFHKILYVLAGKIVYSEPPTPAGPLVDAGTVLIVPRGVRHLILDSTPSTLLLLCLQDEFLATDPDLPQVWRGLVNVARRRIRLSGPVRLRLEAMWRRAMLEKEHARVDGGVMVRALAAQILVLLARQRSHGMSDQAAVRVVAVAHEMEETFYDDWNLDRAAARAGLSRRQFSQLFRIAVKQTFWEYLSGLRLRHAARLLSAGEHSVVAVMFSCGFSDVSHFYRLFRQRFGMPPKAWASAKRGKSHQPPG